MDLIGSARELRGWMPIRVNWRVDEPFIDWIYAGDARFTDPFFDHTVERLLQKPFNLVFRRLTNIDALQACTTDLPSLEPTGFIFHMSRCGSTLVSRMLASLEQNVVISEASPLDWMIRADVRRPQISDNEHVDWIRWMVRSLAQKRDPLATHFFVKFDAWHTLYFDLIERAFPNVPWIFLYRNPSEVLVSHAKRRGAGTMPGVIEHKIDGLSLVEALQFPQEEYPAFVLAEICRAAVNRRDSVNGKFVNYTSLPQFVCGGLLKHFSLEYSDEDIAKMNDAASYNAKSPSVKFTSDTEDKRREARGEIDAIADKYLAVIYKELEAAAASKPPKPR